MRRNLLTTFKADQRGAVAVLSAFMAVALLGFGAIAVDASDYYYMKRKQQTATDLAALAAANNLGSSNGALTGATNAAAASAQSNGFTSSAITNVELGTYTPDPTVPVASRFVPTTIAPNAVRVTMSAKAPVWLGSIFSMANAATTTTTPANGASVIVGSTASGGPTIKTQSVSAAQNAASFALGSGLASLNGGVLNAMLSSLLGSQVSLSLMDYQSLASTNVDLFQFSNALATKAQLTAGTYSTLAQGSVSMPSALQALSSTLGSTAAGTALNEILAALPGQGGTLALGSLLNFGPYGNDTIGAVPPISASVDALDLVTAILQAANGQHQIEASLGVSLPGIASSSLKLTVGEPAVGSSLVTMGLTGATLHTAQTRLRLTVQLLGVPPIATISLPITIEIASGTAVLRSVACSDNTVNTASVGIGVTPGLVNAWIGAVSDQNMATLSTPLNPSPATIVNVLGILTATASANASISNMQMTPLTFSYADIQALNKKNVSTTDFLAPLVQSLIGSTKINVSLLGLNLLSPLAQQQSIASTLTNAVTPIDQILAMVLSGLGVQVGNATTWVSGVKCGQAVLVN